MFLLISAALAGDVHLEFETPETGPAAVTFHEVEDGDLIMLTIPDAEGQPAAMFQARVETEEDAEGALVVTFRMEVHGLRERRGALHREWLSSPTISALDGQQGELVMGNDQQTELRIGIRSDFSEE